MMQTAQRKYAIERVDILERQKVDALQKQHRVEGKSLSETERYQLLADRKVKLRTDISTICRYTDVVNAFDFSKHEWSNHTSVAGDTAIADVKKEAARVRDLIMLGDAAEALAVLQAFAEA